MMCRMTTTPRRGGPTYISRARAALRLGCSTRTIDRYCERGLLTKHYDPVQRRAGIVLAEVEAIERDRIEVSA